MDNDMKARLLELADKVAALEGPNREVDREIGSLMGMRAVDEGHPLGICYYDQQNQIIILPAYTRSVDAALTLGLEGALWSFPAAYMGDGPVLAVVRGISGGRFLPQPLEASAATPALALTAAALRAIAHQKDG